MIKAELVELDRGALRPRPGTRVVVQFNPEALNVSYANAVGTEQDAAAPGATTLRMQLWFDVSAEPESTGEADVRQLTGRIVHFMTPEPRDGDSSVRRLVRFTWGTYQFDGILESVDETFDFFSPDGRPLRASLTLVMSSDHIQFQLGPRASSSG